MGILASLTLKQENLQIKWKWNVNDLLIGREWQIDLAQIIENQRMKTESEENSDLNKIKKFDCCI